MCVHCNFKWLLKDETCQRMGREEEEGGGRRGLILIIEKRTVNFCSVFIYSFLRVLIVSSFHHSCTSWRFKNNNKKKSSTLIKTIGELETLWNSVNGRHCHGDNIDPRRRVYLTEQIPAVSRLSYSSQCPMQMPRRNQMQQHDAFITLSIILMRQYWNKAGPRPVIELKKALSAAGNFSLTRKPYAGSSPLSASEGSAGLYLSAETLLPLFTSAAAQTITLIHMTRCKKKNPTH